MSKTTNQPSNQNIIQDHIQNSHLKHILYLPQSTFLKGVLEDEVKQQIFEISRGQKWTIE